jgi:hypothetical protein
MRRSRVASCFASSTQQINSLRANGVMSNQAASATEFAVSASRKSTGSLCTTPPGTLERLTVPRVARADGRRAMRKELAEFWVRERAGSSFRALLADPETTAFELAEEPGRSPALRRGSIPLLPVVITLLGGDKSMFHEPSSGI